MSSVTLHVSGAETSLPSLVDTSTVEYAVLGAFTLVAAKPHVSAKKIASDIMNM